MEIVRLKDKNILKSFVYVVLNCPPESVFIYTPTAGYETAIEKLITFLKGELKDPINYIFDYGLWNDMN